MSDREDDFTEESTLLPAPTPAPKKPNPHLSIYTKLCAIIFLVNVAFQILMPAQTRIYERIFCEQYYEDHKTDQTFDGRIPEHLCKIAPVQRQVSSLKGWIEFFEATPGLFVAIPIGILSDIFGRQTFARLTLLVIFVQQLWISLVTFFPKTIPIHTVWLEGALNFISGGKMVAEALFACIITDITPSEQLSTAFFRFNAVGCLTKVIGPAIAGSLMHFEAWYAILAGLTGLLCMIIVAFTVPETLRDLQHYTLLSATEGSNPTHRKLNQLRAFKTIVLTAIKELAIVWTDWRLLFLTLLYPFRMFSNALGDLVQLYVSNRYNWTLANATFLYSLQAVAATIVLFLLLPAFADLLENKYQLSAIQKNVVLSRISLFVLAIAYLIEGLAPTIALLLFGLVFETFASGLSSTLRALAGSLVDSKDNGRVFSVLAISETVSTMFAYPAATALFNVGLDNGGGVWLGLPLFVTAGMAVVAFGAMSLLRFDRR